MRDKSGEENWEVRYDMPDHCSGVEWIYTPGVFIADKMTKSQIKNKDGPQTMCLVSMVYVISMTS